MRWIIKQKSSVNGINNNDDDDNDYNNNHKDNGGNTNDNEDKDVHTCKNESNNIIDEKNSTIQLGVNHNIDETRCDDDNVVIEFRGFLEPNMIDGHERKWKH